MTKPPHERRAELIAAARALFDERGVDKTRVSDIVRRVGVAQGVFYYYFSSKDEMVREVVTQVGQEMEARAAAIVRDEAATLYEKLALFIELFLDLIDQFLGDEETSLVSLNGSTYRGKLAEAYTGSLMEMLRELVAAGVAAGRIKAEYPWETAQLLLFGFKRLADEHLPERRTIYTIVEQALCLENGALTSLLEQRQALHRNKKNKGA